MLFLFYLIYQNLGVNIGALKSDYQSQKQPVLSPGNIDQKEMKEV